MGLAVPFQSWESVHDARMQKPTEAAQDRGIDPRFDIRSQIGPRLKQVRMLIDQNRTRLAERYGVHHTRWRAWEEGFYYPDAGVMAAFCSEWKVTMDWLYLGRMEGLDERLKTLMYLEYPELLQKQSRPPAPSPLPIRPESEGRYIIPGSPAKGRRRRGKRLHEGDEA